MITDKPINRSNSKSYRATAGEAYVVHDAANKIVAEGLANPITEESGGGSTVGTPAANILVIGQPEETSEYKTFTGVAKEIIESGAEVAKVGHSL